VSPPPALPALAFGASILAYALAFAAWRRGRPGLAAALVVAGGFSLRLYAASDDYLHAWDERFHALVAKNLMAHPLRPTLYDTPLLPFDYREWLEAEVWLHKPPLVLWLMALAMGGLGVGELALRLPSLLLSSAATWATYRIGVAFRGPDTGLVAALLHSANAFLVLLAGGWFATDHVDVGLASFVTLAVAAGVAGRPRPASFAVAGLLSGLALLSKGLPGLLALPVVALWHVGEARAARLAGLTAIAFVVCLAVAAPWWLYASAAFPNEAAWERGYDLRHLTEPLEGHGGSALYHVARMPKIFGEIVYLPLLFWFWRLARGPRDPRAIALTAWLVLPYGVFSLAASKMPAYVMVAAPAVFLVVATACTWLLEQWRGGTRPKWILALSAAALLAPPVRILLNDLRLFREHERRPAWAAELEQLGRRLAGQRAVILGSPRPIETMFYTSQVAYERVPDRSTVEALQSRGYRVLIHDSPVLSPERRGLRDVEYLPALPAPPP
jgi:4-amino-4-deoxy-L-arabinose transferase